MAAAVKVSPSALPPRRSSTHPEEKAAVLQAVKEMTSGTAQKKSGDPAPDQSSELDEETVTKRTENIIGELCENKDLKVKWSAKMEAHAHSKHTLKMEAHAYTVSIP